MYHLAVRVSKPSPLEGKGRKEKEEKPAQPSRLPIITGPTRIMAVANSLRYRNTNPEYSPKCYLKRRDVGKLRGERNRRRAW